MPKRRILWKIYPIYMVVILLCAGTVAAIALAAARSLYEKSVSNSLRVNATLVARQVADRVSQADPAEFEAFCRQLGRDAASRITIIAPDGRVLCDSIVDPSTMRSESDRPEIAQAFATGEGSSTRYSPDLRENMLYYAISVSRDGRPLYVVRTSVTVSEIEAALASIYRQIALGALLTVALAAFIGFVGSSRMSRQIDEIKLGAERFARGDLSYKLPPSDTREVSGLADAFNRMAGELEERMHTIDRQKNEQQAVLSSMTEGVLAVDSDQKIINLNQAAATLLGVARAQAEGRALQEVVRNSELERLVSEVLEKDRTAEGEITLHDETGRLLEVRSAALLDAMGIQIGALMVLTDVTRLRRLETVRRDFVANVSHELKTPVTSIKGFVETLREGAIEEPSRAKRFLDIIAKQVDRLNAIIDDLLALSRIEQESDRAQIELEESKIRDILQSAISGIDSRRSEKQITIDLNCDKDLSWRVNPALLEQAVINLIDNAIKYSETGSVVTVGAVRRDGEIAVSVQDTGCGIEKKHLPRLFERFYRVDKARSRTLGGTGLGLAIVKHIAQAHGGTVEVESAPGKGSTFTLRIPAVEHRA